MYTIGVAKQQETVSSAFPRAQRENLLSKFKGGFYLYNNLGDEVVAKMFNRYLTSVLFLTL